MLKWVRFTSIYSVVFFNDTATTEIYTLSLRDALPSFECSARMRLRIEDDPGDETHPRRVDGGSGSMVRSEEHTSELQSRRNLVCRLLLEKTKIFFSLLLSLLLFIF